MNDHNATEMQKKNNLIIFFSVKKIMVLCILKGISPFKMHKIIDNFFFSKKNLDKKFKFHH